MTAKHTVAAVILAAGTSTRMGDHNKLLACIDGTPMVHRVVKVALESDVQSSVVVTGFEADKVNDNLAKLGVRTVNNPNYRDGLASSLRIGINAVPNADAAVVLLADMPFVSTRHINQLIQCFDKNSDTDIIVPVHKGRRGNPVLWASRYFPQLANLQGDKGARDMLKQFESRVCKVPIDSDAIFTDIDTVDQLLSANSL